MSDTITETSTYDEAPPRRLVRADEGRWLGGVCAGLGRYFDVNPLIYRIAFAALALAGGTGLLLYLAAWLVIPGERSEESIAVEALRRHRDRPWLLLGVGLLSFGALLALSEARFWPGTGNLWLAATLGGAARRLVARRESRPCSAQRRRDRDRANRRGRVDRDRAGAGARRPRRASRGREPPREAVALRAGARRPPRRRGPVRPPRGARRLRRRPRRGSRRRRRDRRRRDRDRRDDAAARRRARLPRADPAGARSASPPRRRSRSPRASARRSSAPRRSRRFDPSYELGIGELNLDLSAVSLPAGTTPVDANVGVGNLVITVPRGRRARDRRPRRSR